MRGLLALAAAAVATAGLPASLSLVGNRLVFANGFVQVGFDLKRAAVDVVQGRFEGDGAFLSPGDVSPNVGVRTPSNAAIVPQGTAAGAIAVVITGNDAGSYAETSTSGWTRPSPLAYEVLSNTTDLVAFRVANITDAATGARVSAAFTFALAAGSRSFTFNATVAPLTAFNATAVRVSTGWAPGNMVMMYTAGAWTPRPCLPGRATFTASAAATTTTTTLPSNHPPPCCSFFPMPCPDLCRRAAGVLHGAALHRVHGRDALGPVVRDGWRPRRRGHRAS